MKEDGIKWPNIKLQGELTFRETALALKSTLKSKTTIM